MIQLKVGVDLVETDRMAGLKPSIRARFIQRVFTEQEQSQARDVDEALIARFAAKEAVSKALGSGIGPVSWREIEVIEAPSGEPHISLTGAAARIAAELGIERWAVSLSHSRSHAVAFVVAWGGDETVMLPGDSG